MPSTLDPARDLLFGLIALQNGLIQQAQLVAAFHAWTCDKARSLADHLVQRGDLDADDRVAVEALVTRHLKRHGGDVEKSLAAVPAGKSTRESLASLDDPDIEATLCHVASGHGSTEHDGEADADRTTSYAVGTASSEGQRFRVLRPHARGGLGAVFVALDAELNREVALKQILDRHADDATSRARFLLEAEVTGGLEHPGIVPVYGLGTYADGRPYYAMRFIRGDSLKEAIDRYHAAMTRPISPSPRAGEGRGEGAGAASASNRALELRKLLRRFTDVCNAIDYAHSRGVLHRDIKPGNIIVGKHGETLVVDWGLAKATGKAEPGAEERTLVPSSASGSAETLPGSALGTPAYMSPEQARGDLEHLGPQSDVYSLGATLYCLLTGKPPQEGEDLGEVLRKVQRGEFPRPRQHDPTIDAALEAICLKAMALKPEDRYATPRLLADDIERWMADEPVLAWREPASRRLLRWVTRHRTGVTGAAAAVLAGVVGLSAVLAVQARANSQLSAALTRETAANTALAAANGELSRSKAAVQARYDLAVDAIKTFHTGVSEDFLLKEPQFKVLRDRLLRSAADFYGKLSTLLGKETDLHSRRSLGQTSFKLAELTAQVGRVEDALGAHRAVLSARKALATANDKAPELLADVGQSLIAVGEMLHDTGKTDEARAAFEEACATVAGQDGTPARGPAASELLITANNRLGWLLFQTGQSDRALEALERARGLQAGDAPGPPLSKSARIERAYTSSAQGLVLEARGQMAEALAAHELTLALREKLVEEYPDDLALKTGVAQSHLNRGNMLALLGRTADALAEFQASKAIRLKLVEENPSVGLLRSRLVDSLRRIGRLLRLDGWTSEAEIELQMALEHAAKLAQDHPSVTDYQANLAYAHYDLGNLALDDGRVADCVSYFRKALAIRQELLQKYPKLKEVRSEHGASVADLAWALSQAGSKDEAVPSCRRAIETFKKLVAEEPKDNELQRRLAASHMMLANLLLSMEKTQAAEDEYRRGLAIVQALARENPTVSEFRSLLAYFHYNLAELYQRTGSMSKAQFEQQAALSLRRRLAADHPAEVDSQRTVAASLIQVGTQMRLTGNSALAEAADREGIRILEPLAAAHPRVLSVQESLARAHLELGKLQADLGERTQATAEIGSAIEILERASGARGQKLSIRTMLPTARAERAALLAAADQLTAVDQELQSAVAMRENLIKMHPSEVDLKNDLAISRAALADVHARQGDARRASDELRAAFAVQEQLVREHPEIVEFRSSLADSIRRLGVNSAKLGNYREAAVCVQRALSIRESLPYRSGRDWFEEACCHAQFASLGGRDDSGVTGEEASAHADAAMLLLYKAVGMGYRSIDAFRTEDCLDPLRSRNDFKLSMMDLAFPTDPFAMGD